MFTPKHRLRVVFSLGSIILALYPKFGNAIHPFIWTFINALKKEDKLNQFKVEQAIIAGYSLL